MTTSTHIDSMTIEHSDCSHEQQQSQVAILVFVGVMMAKLHQSASNRRASRRAALAMFDLSGKSSREIFAAKLPKREFGDQSSDWNNIGKDLRKAINKIGPSAEIIRGR